MKNTLRIRFHLWLALVMIALALLTLAFQGGADEVDPAHCRPCVTRTSTPTATLTPTPLPVLQSCQIQEIYFNEQLYNWGETITATVDVPLHVTVKLVDHQGQILIGANVDATVTQTSTVQTAAAIPPLVDQSGTYDGVYDPQNPGLYSFKFSASDFTGPRFLPCEAEAIVQVEPTVTPLPMCEVQVTAEPSQAQLNQTITLTANVTVNATPQSGAVVTAGVTRPDSPPEDSLNFTGDGPYRGEYGHTNLAGNYTFQVSVQDNPPNQRFLGCTAAPITIPVATSPTPPPTQTIDILLPPQPIDLCGHSSSNISGTITLNNVANLTGAQLEVSYDPTFIQVIDAFGRPRPPVQVRPDPNFDPFLRNQVDTRQGRVYFAANAHTPVTGSSNVIYIDWRLQGRTGSTQINVTGVLTDEGGVRNVTATAPLVIIINSTCVQGTVNLQGRADHSGVTVATSAGQQTQSYPSGLFAIAAAEPLRLVYPGYLPGQIDMPPGATGTPGGEAATLGTITLLAGDVNGDQIINILDLAYLAQRFQSADVTADLNADGIVDILDLALVAGNYQP